MSRNTLNHARPGRTWPILLLILAAILIPTVCILWFMNVAVQNEQLAIRQRLTDLYAHQLTTVHNAIGLELDLRVRRVWDSRDLPAAKAFEVIARAQAADGVLLFDPPDTLAYPILQIPAPRMTLPPDWPIADALEAQAHFHDATHHWADIASAASDANIQALALRNEARCLAESTQFPAAIALFKKLFNDPHFASARDLDGNLLAPVAALRAIELLAQTHQPSADLTAALLARINNYDGAPMPSAQRLFLMRQLQADTGLASTSADLEALSLQAANTLNLAHPFDEPALDLQRTPIEDVWGMDGRFVTPLTPWHPTYRSVILYRTDTLRSIARAAIAKASLPPNIDINLPPDPINHGEGMRYHPVLEMDSLYPFRGHNIGLALTDEFPFAIIGQRSLYIWTAALTIAAITSLGLLLSGFLHRQLRLTRLKNDLIATVSHELKTPLASMRLLVDTLLEHRTTSPEQSHEYLSLIARENTRLSRLIDNFLTFSRMERSKHRFTVAPVNLADLLTEALAAIPERAPAITTHLDAPPESLTVQGDYEALLTLLLNLLDNAWKYADAPRRIEVRAARTPSKILLTVSDNGIGIAPRHHKKIFHRFYQIDHSLTRKTNGTGLGLAIVHLIATAHHARITVESIPQKGSTFTIAFPASPLKIDPPSKTTEFTENTETKK